MRKFKFYGRKMMITALCLAMTAGMSTGCYGQDINSNSSTNQQTTGDSTAPNATESNMETEMNTAADPQSSSDSTENTQATEAENVRLEKEYGIQFANLDEYAFVTKNVNLHKGPSEETDVLAVVMKNTCLKQTGYSSNWARVLYDGGVYYIQTKYIRSPKEGDVIPSELESGNESQSSTGTSTDKNGETKTEPEETDTTETTQETTGESTQEGETSTEASAEPTPTQSSGPTAPSSEQPAIQGVLSREQMEALPNDTIGWGYATADRDEYNRPNGCLYYERLYGKYGAEFIRLDTNEVFLTFDEGYEAGYTPVILDTLKEKNVKAVFFVTLQYCKQNPELVRRMIDEGHVVGNHSAAHPSGGLPQFGIDGTYEDLVKVHDYVQENFGYSMYLMRYPEGAFSEQSLALLQSMGYRTVFWSFAHADWDQNNQPEVSVTYDRVTGQLHPGAIYLLHAVSSSDTAALGDFIDYAKAQGYTFGNYNR